MSAQHAVLIRTLFVWAGFGVFLALELLAPYRPSTASKPRRWRTNLSLTAANGLFLNLAFGAAILASVGYVTEQHDGLLYLCGLPPWARLFVAVAFLDLMLYVWHLLNHEMPTLWRFHRVHHSDLNMDVSTATRFHVGELSISAAIKIALVFFLGSRWWSSWSSRSSWSCAPSSTTARSAFRGGSNGSSGSSWSLPLCTESTTRW